jgi:hypothetical protein
LVFDFFKISLHFQFGVFFGNDFRLLPDTDVVVGELPNFFDVDPGGAAFDVVGVDFSLLPVNSMNRGTLNG